MLAVTTTAVVVFVGVEQGVLLCHVLVAVPASFITATVRTQRFLNRLVTESGTSRSDNFTGAITEPGLVLYRFGAPLYYANANSFPEETQMAASAPSPLHWLIVDAGAITNVDFTAARVVRELQKDLSVQGTGLVFAHVQSDLKPDLNRHHLTEVIGPSRIFDSLHEALAALRGSVPSF